MNSRLIRPLMMGVFAFPLLVTAQQGNVSQNMVGNVRYTDPGNNFYSNVPINELSVKAYRRFHRRFHDVITNESWFKSAQGYQVSFLADRRYHLAYFDPGGAFMYLLTYYDGKEAPRDAGEVVKRRFPDFKMGVVTEVNDGQRSVYIVQIMSPLFVKVLTIADGRIDVVKELENGGSDIGPAAR